jgi:hypothetical protein
MSLNPPGAYPATIYIQTLDCPQDHKISQFPHIIISLTLTLSLVGAVAALDGLLLLRHIYITAFSIVAGFFDWRIDHIDWQIPANDIRLQYHPTIELFYLLSSLTTNPFSSRCGSLEVVVVAQKEKTKTNTQKWGFHNKSLDHFLPFW